MVSYQNALNFEKTQKKLLLYFFAEKSVGIFCVSIIYLQMTDILWKKNAKIFYCEYCDFDCSKQSNYDKHLLTLKHQKTYNSLTKPQKNAVPSYFCNCGKTYNHRQSLYKHKLSCKPCPPNYDNLDDKSLIIQLLQQNQELQKSLIELSKEKTINNSFNNSNNKTFNLQFFLNETCKDAMNISDFVQTIKPQLIDLETTGRVGYVEGITNIILNNLKTLKIHERPLHCSDQKREVIYIKDNDIWTKENDDKPILTKAIKVIANENIKNIGQWRKEYPDCTNSDSKKNKLYLKIVSNSMSGLSKEESDKNLHKIITNISKEVIIDKN